MTIKYSYIAVFAAGLVLGILAQLGVQAISQTEKDWRNQHGEEANHKRITDFQEVLKNQGTAKSAEELEKQIGVQLKIEELVIQSRAAQYAGLTPFTSLGSTVGTVLIGLLGFIGGLIGKKRDVTVAPNL